MKKRNGQAGQQSDHQPPTCVSRLDLDYWEYDDGLIGAPLTRWTMKQSDHQHPGQAPAPMYKLNLDYWEYDDGLIGAHLNQQDEKGTLISESMVQMACALTDLLKTLTTLGASIRARASWSDLVRQMDLPMTAQWIEGEVCVAFSQHPGLVICSPSEERFIEFMIYLMDLAMQEKDRIAVDEKGKTK